MDDWIPVHKNYKGEYELIYNHSKDRGEAWPCIAEKCYAKLFGSYQVDKFYYLIEFINILFGSILKVEEQCLLLWTSLEVSPKQSLVGMGISRMLTRISTQNWRQFLKGKNIIIRKNNKVVIHSYDETNTMVCAGVSGPDTEGVVGGHAYSIFGIFEDRNLNIPRLVKVRNPWGRADQGVWTGRWSPAWLKRHNMMKEAEMLKCGAGEFFIPIEDFLSIFCSVSICWDLGQDYEELHDTASWTPEMKTVEFFLTLESRGSVYIAISQKDRRQLRDELQSENTMLKIRLKIKKVVGHEDRDQEIYSSSFNPLRTLTYHKETPLERGTYKIVGQVLHLQQPEQSVFLRVASNTKIRLRRGCEVS